LIDQVNPTNVPNQEEEEGENPEEGGEGMESGMERDSDLEADMDAQRRTLEKYESDLNEAQKALDAESGEEEIVKMKGRYHPEMMDQQMSDNEGESPVAGSESHKYLEGFNDEDDEEREQA
jgi:hypothetical protein